MSYCIRWTRAKKLNDHSMIQKLKRFFGQDQRTLQEQQTAANTLITDLYQLITVIKKPGGFRVSFYKTDASCGCQGDLRLVFIPTEKEKLSKAEIVEAIENGYCEYLR